MENHSQAISPPSSSVVRACYRDERGRLMEEKVMFVIKSAPRTPENTYIEEDVE